MGDIRHIENTQKIGTTCNNKQMLRLVDCVKQTEWKITATEHIVKKVEDDLNETKEELKKEKKILEEKKKAFDNLITSQKQKEEEESKLVEELRVTKGLLNKAYEDLVIKTNALDAEMEKVNVSEVSIQTDPEIN